MHRFFTITALSVGALFMISGPSQAYYDDFQPPYGFYLNYECHNPEAEPPLHISADLKALQGVLSLEVYDPKTDETILGYSQDLPQRGEFSGQNAWEYSFATENTGASSILLTVIDYWDEFPDEVIITEYFPEVDGPRAPALIGAYQCDVMDAGVNPDL